MKLKKEGIIALFSRQREELPILKWISNIKSNYGISIIRKKNWPRPLVVHKTFPVVGKPHKRPTFLKILPKYCKRNIVKMDCLWGFPKVSHLWSFPSGIKSRGFLVCWWLWLNFFMRIMDTSWILEIFRFTSKSATPPLKRGYME